MPSYKFLYFSLFGMESFIFKFLNPLFLNFAEISLTLNDSAVHRQINVPRFWCSHLNFIF